MRSRTFLDNLLSVLLVTAFATGAEAQPWDFFIDPLTGESCDLINTEFLELVVLDSELVVITGLDEFILGSFVDAEGTVFFDGFAVGFIAFATDGDGFRSLWILTGPEIDPTVLSIDPDTFFPSDSLLFPDEFVEVPCDACPFWDDPFDCEDIIIIIDDDDDGVPDDEDFCLDTPFGAEVDFDGCACFELDSDGDGIDDCDDLCPNTPINADIGVDGCTVVAEPPPVVVSCGGFGAILLGLTVFGLFSMRFVGRRW